MLSLKEDSEVVSRRTTSPDILASSSPDRMPLGVELKVWAAMPSDFGNRVSNALATSVQARRSLPEDVSLALVVVVLPSGDRPGGRDQLIEGTKALLRESDGVGFDRIFLGFVGPVSTWHDLSKDEFRPDTGFDQILLALKRMTYLPRTHAAVDGHEHEHPRVLLVSDEWGSSLGGVSTLNRTLSIALAKAGAEVSLLLTKFEPDEVKEAGRDGVILYSPASVPGILDNAALLSPATYPHGYSPDLIIGHGRVLGPYAFAVQKNQFPSAKRLHIVHTDAERLEAVKAETTGRSPMKRASERRALELELSESAQLVAGIGPLLTETISALLRGSALTPDIFEIAPGLKEWGKVANPAYPPRQAEFLVLGRSDDLRAKGLDIAARATALANDSLTASGERNVTLYVRGVLPEDEKRTRKKLTRWAGTGRVALRPYTTLETELRTDIFKATTVLMPSRHEGFGLSAYEAIGAGVPVLVSEESGVGQLIRRLDPLAPEVLPTSGSEAFVLESWSDAVVNNTINAVDAFERAAELRALIIASHGWSQVIDAIFKRL